MTAYYNEIDPFAAAWLRELIKAGHIAPGEVDERSIEDVKPNDLRGYKQCHFFAGIGVWSYALRQAGWDDDRPVWTGSCPCQAISSATHGKSVAQELWPEFRRLITGSKPPTVFGEQVPKKWWVERLCADMASVGYDIGGAVLPAYSVKKDHARERFYFVAHTDVCGKYERTVNAKTQVLSWRPSHAGELPGANGSPNRVGRLRGYGNAIVAPVATAFIEAFLETETERGSQ